MPRILVYHTLAFALGIIGGHYLHISVGILLIVTGAVFLSCLISLCLNWQPVLFLVFSCFAGMLWGQVNEIVYTDLVFAPEDNVQVVGMVVTQPYHAGAGIMYVIKPERINGRVYRGKSKISVYSEPGQEISYGDVLTIEGKFMAAGIPSNPHQFDYSAYQKRKGIIGTISTAYGGKAAPTGENRGKTFLKMAFAVKKRMLLAIENLPPKQGVFITGMLFGDKGNLSYQDRSILSQTGLMDAFAVSGVHVGFVVLFTLSLAHGLGLKKTGRLILVSVVMCFYAAVSGFTPSVVRSGVMAILGLLAFSFGAKKDFLTALAAAALTLLFWNPQNVFDAGFQLSFLAAGGVIYLSPALTGLWTGGRKVWQAAAAAASAQLALMPLLAYYFNILTVSGIVLGIAASGLVGLVVLLGLFSLMLCPVSINLAVIPLYLAGVAVEGIWQAAGIISRFPGSYLIVKTPSLMVIFLFYAFLLFLPVLVNRTWGKKFSAAFVVFLICLIAFPWGNHRLNVTFLDVGQGDCIFVQTPGKRNVLIDGGGRPARSSYDVGERVVLPFLKSLGISHLDLVINTHPHDDHVNGLKAVLRDMKVDQVVIAHPFYHDPEGAELLSWAGEQNIPVFPASCGQTIYLEPGIELFIMHPGVPIKGTDSDANNNSLIIKLSYLHTSFLFTGDAEVEALAELRKKKLSVDFRSDVVKVPHHGSKNGLDPDFFDQVSPRMAVISVGKNSFGHPDPEVLKYWHDKGTPVYRTDYYGAVTISSDGKEITVQTVKSPESGISALTPKELTGTMISMR